MNTRPEKRLINTKATEAETELKLKQKLKFRPESES